MQPTHLLYSVLAKDWTPVQCEYWCGHWAKPLASLPLFVYLPMPLSGSFSWGLLWVDRHTVQSAIIHQLWLLLAVTLQWLIGSQFTSSVLADWWPGGDYSNCLKALCHRPQFDIHPTQKMTWLKQDDVYVWSHWQYLSVSIAECLLLADLSVILVLRHPVEPTYSRKHIYSFAGRSHIPPPAGEHWQPTGVSTQGCQNSFHGGPSVNRF